MRLTKEPMLSLIRDTKGLRGYFNIFVRRFFGFDGYLEYGINFQEKKLLLLRSSKYIESSHKVCFPLRAPERLLDELDKRIDIPYGESVIWGKVVDDDSIVFDLTKLHRRFPGGRINYGYD